jgi:hypothetical protein
MSATSVVVIAMMISVIVMTMIDATVSQTQRSLRSRCNACLLAGDVFCRLACKDGAENGDRSCIASTDINRICNGQFMTHVQLCQEENSTLAYTTVACETTGPDPRAPPVGSVGATGGPGGSTQNTNGGAGPSGEPESDVVPIVIGCVVGCIALVLILVLVAVIVSRRKTTSHPTDVVVNVANTSAADDQQSAEDSSSEASPVGKTKYVEQAHGDSDDEANRTERVRSTASKTKSTAGSGYATQAGFDSESD